MIPTCVHFRNKTLQTNALLTLDPNISGVFSGPYPFGIDPVSKRESDHTTPPSAVGQNITDSDIPTDMELGGESALLPQLLQDEDVCHHRCRTHDLWSGAECLQSLVSDSSQRARAPLYHVYHTCTVWESHQRQPACQAKRMTAFEGSYVIIL